LLWGSKCQQRTEDCRAPVSSARKVALKISWSQLDDNFVASSQYFAYHQTSASVFWIRFWHSNGRARTSLMGRCDYLVPTQRMPPSLTKCNRLQRIMRRFNLWKHLSVKITRAAIAGAGLPSCANILTEAGHTYSPGNARMCFGWRCGSGKTKTETGMNRGCISLGLS